MTVGKLKEIFDTFQIPNNVILESDSGWECGPTDMDGIFYNKNKGVITFEQGNFKYDFLAHIGEICLYHPNSNERLEYGEYINTGAYIDKNTNEIIPINEPGDFNEISTNI